MSLIDSFPNLEYDHAIFGIMGKASTGLLPQNRDLTVNISDMSALDYERWIMVHISLVSCLLFLPCKENFSLKRSRIFPSWSQGILVDETIILSGISAECTQTCPKNVGSFGLLCSKCYFLHLVFAIKSPLFTDTGKCNTHRDQSSKMADSEDCAHRMMPLRKYNLQNFVGKE